MRVDTPGALGGATPSSTMRTAPAHEVVAVVGAGDPERLAQARRAREQIAVAPGLHPPRRASRSMPSTGAAARSSTAAASPFLVATTLAHQCMP